MTIRRLYILAAFALVGLCAGSCQWTAFKTFSDVHEWPPTYPSEITLSLVFDESLEAYRTIDMDATRSVSGDDRWQYRHQLRVYRLYDGVPIGEPVMRQVYTVTDQAPDTTVVFELGEGTYRAFVWTDVVPSGSTEDYYYKTDNFSSVVVDPHHFAGSTVTKDAFRGVLDIITEQDSYEGHFYSLEMAPLRPVGMFRFIATDVNEFVAKYLQEHEDITRAALDLTQFNVVFYYSGYYPNTYNVLTGRPVDAITGVHFDSVVRLVDDGKTAVMGYDYVLVNGEESSVQVSLGFYDMDNILVSMISGIEVPLRRSGITTIRGRFLTEGASSGVSINPDFDGEYTVYIE